MTVVDVNVLLYALNSAAPHHSAASGWLEEELSGSETVALPWVTLLAFIRLTTSSHVFPSPLTVGEAVTVLEGWLALPGVVVVVPTPRHLAVLHGLLSESGTAGNLVSDAHLATLALEHGAAVASFDRDFRRFRGLRVVVPGQRTS